MNEAPYAAAPQASLTNRSRRRGSIAFTVLVSIALVLGAAVMALVLFLSGAPQALVIGVVLAAVPVGPVVASFLWLDRYEPEPRGLLVFAFGWGALVATSIALVLQVLEQATIGLSEAWSATLVAPVTEEGAKGLFVLLLMWARRHEVDGILDGIVYAGIVAAGFAFTENILYLGGAYMGDGIGPGGLEAATGTFVLRGIFSPFAHPLFTVAIGIGVGFALVTRRRAVRYVALLGGFMVAVLAHALWNGSVFLGGGRLFLLTYLFAMVPAFLLAVGFAVWVRRREGQMLRRALADCAGRGFLPQHEVPWLVSLPGRRAARGFAKARGGRAGAKAMTDYQQQAIELAFLHDRYLRGSAPADFAARGQTMVDRLAALRPHAVFPHASPGTGPGAMAPAGGYR